MMFTNVMVLNIRSRGRINDSLLKTISGLGMQDMQSLIHNGIYRQQFQEVIEELAFPDNWLPAALGITEVNFKTKYWGAPLVSGPVTDRLIMIANLFYSGMRHFESRRTFYEWLVLPRAELSFISAGRALKHLVGLEMVIRLLGEFPNEQRNSDKSKGVPILLKLNEMPFKDKLQMIEDGIESKTVEELRKELLLTPDEMARLLGVSQGAFYQNCRKKRISSKLTDRLFFLCTLYMKGVRVIGNIDKTDHWLRGGNRRYKIKDWISHNHLNTIVGITDAKIQLYRHEFGTF